MKKLMIVISLTAGILAMGYGAWNAEASTGLSLSYSFVGCSGRQVTYDLLATHPDGGPFTWSQGANPISGPNADPNYADTSYIKGSQMIWVQAHGEMFTIHLTNPCR